MSWTEAAVKSFCQPARNTDLLQRHAEFARKIIRKDYDWWVINEGYEGSGKSSGSIWTGHYVGRENFSISENICYDPDEFLRLVDDVPPYSVIILDEAGEAFYNRNFNSETNKAVAMANQQMRDRNLYVEFNLPAIELLDSALRRRFRTLTIYEDPNFVRGKSMWHVPVRPRYGKKGEPYWDHIFTYYSNDIPAKWREEYKVIKTQRGRERLVRYIDEVQREQAKNIEVDPQKIVQQIRRMSESERAQLRSARGDGYNRDAVRFRFRLPESVARSVVAGLRLSPADGT
jgi:hypothetical protein